MVDSVSASFLASWFSHSYLFLLLNLTIGTIFLITRFGTHKNPHDSPQLARASSSLLERVKSINLSLYKFEPPTAQTELHHLPLEPERATEPPNYPENHNATQIVRTPSFLERLKSINLSAIYRSEQPQPEADPDPRPAVHDHGVERSKSEPSSSSPPPGSASAAAKAEKMTKSASEKSGKQYCEESGAGEREEEEEEEKDNAVEGRRPATARVKRKSLDSQTASSWEDDGVDAKADDFINKFKQQLRLQRLESLKRFSEMWKGK